MECQFREALSFVSAKSEQPGGAFRTPLPSACLAALQTASVRRRAYFRPSSPQRVATRLNNSRLTLLTGGKFVGLKRIVASMPMPRSGGS